MKPTLSDVDAMAAAPVPGAAERSVGLTVVVPVSDRVERLTELHGRMVEALGVARKSLQVIYVVDGRMEKVIDELKTLQARDPAVEVLRLNRWFGEATALAVGLERAAADTILTLPAYPQVEVAELPGIVEAFESRDVDLLVAVRHPRIDSGFNRLQSRVFHAITGMLTGVRYRDVSCGVRVMNRAVARHVDLYGDLHRFFPLLAYQKGFRVEEIDARQSPDDTRSRFHGPGVYLRRLLDIVTLFFVFKFTKKPLRFFGLVGSAVFGVGGVILLYLGIYRILRFGPIGDRPLLILGALLVVLGLQLFSVGLLGEIVIFTHAGGVKDYRIQESGSRSDRRDDAGRV